MKKDKKMKINSGIKLALVNTGIGIILAFILYWILPYILNYPTNTINNDFQVQMVGITYTLQYCILVFLLAIFIFTTFSISYRKLNFSIDVTSKKGEKYYSELRKKLFNYPYITLIVQTIVPTIVCAILLTVFKTNFELLMRICIVILSISAIFAITSYMINRNFFIRKLIDTSNLVKTPVSGLNMRIFKKLLILTFPLFLYTSVLLLLITSSVMTTEKGDLLYRIYHQELVNDFSSSEVYTLPQAKESLEKLALNSDNDYIIMFSATDGAPYYSGGELKDFLVQYTLRYYNQMNGQCFEYYGQDSQASVIKINTTDGEYYVGIHFSVFNSNIFVPFFIVAIITILFNTFYIYYIGKGISTDLNTVINGLKRVATLDNVLEADNLPVTSNYVIGELTIQFNKIQDWTKQHVNQIKNNQDTLMEKERLASLGQLIGGISHNLKTPIMSISGAAEGLTDLINEYDTSIGDPEVTNDDHHAIANDMRDWITKIHSYTSYMSDIITAVKGQAVNLSENESDVFTIDEMIKRVTILMKHEIRNASLTLNTQINVPSTTSLHGDVNSLVQVINNLITNAIQSYNGKKDNTIDLSVNLDGKNVVISVADRGCGMTKEVQDKLFKSMITTKGKNGTGLGMFMSYSTIKGHFNGDITFETEIGKGTKFNVIIPL